MNDYFCVLPFFGYEYYVGRGTHCCLLAKDHNIEQVRADMLNKKRSPSCAACWKLEDAGMISDRKIKNSTLDFYWNRDIRFIEDDARNGKFSPILIKHMTSTTCNSTCVSCSSGASSAWAPLEKRMNLTSYNPVSMTKEDINQNINFKELIGLNLVGGEPLYEKLNFYILEKLIKNDNHKCFIQVTTNGSVTLSNKQKDLLKRFKNLNFNVSIDGVGSVFEYLRFPLKWNDLLNNLEFFRTITNNINVSYTTSNLNVLYHHETIDWFDQQKLPYHFNPIINPKHFRPAALPKSVKDKIFQKYGRTKDLEFFIGSHNNQDDIDYRLMLEKIKQQDMVKGIKIENYLVELYNLLKE